VTGIAWGTTISLAPANTQVLGYSPWNAILLAAADGAAGDVILIEQQAAVCGLPGPCMGPGGDCGPLEAIPPVFDAIQTAVANGLVVVEAAGNGGVNLDQAACGNTFNRTVRDSGAIIVGAGGAPGSGMDRQRLNFSSYGSRVDVQGWGGGVASSGYGVLYINVDDPTNRNFWYTNAFSGTSSASSMIAGAATDLQGIARQQSSTPLNPRQVRQILVDTGSPQLGDTSQHIGPRPNLKAASNLKAICQQGCNDVDATCEDNCTANFGSCSSETPHLDCIKAFRACLKDCTNQQAQCLAKCQ
jgi:serine protease